MARWDIIKQTIIDDLNFRTLKNPSIRINAIEKIDIIVHQLYPEYLDDMDALKNSGKEVFKKQIENGKGGKLNSAEQSVINDIFRIIDPQAYPKRYRYVCHYCGNTDSGTENKVWHKCSACGKVFQASTPLDKRLASTTNNQTISTEQPKSSILKWICSIITVLAIFFMIGKCNVDDPKIDVRAGVQYYLKHHYLKDPKSYESISWSEVGTDELGEYYIRHRYRAKNSFGGYVVEEKTFYLDKDYRIIRVTDL